MEAILSFHAVEKPLSVPRLIIRLYLIEVPPSKMSPVWRAPTNKLLIAGSVILSTPVERAQLTSIYPML